MRALNKAAELHKKTFESMLESIGVEIVVYQPQVRSGSGMGDKAFGPRATETTNGVSSTVRVIWSNDYLDTNLSGLSDASIASPIASLGANGRAPDVVIRMALADVVNVPEALQGRTLFDTCREIVYQGQAFEVLNTRRTGLPPIGPYILWAGLRRKDKNVP
jgi:hypothetical protein